MPLSPFGILFAFGLLLAAVFGAMHWVMACEEGMLWGFLALIPGVALSFTFRFWHRRWVRRCFVGGALSFSLAIASLIGFILKIPGLTQQLQAHQNGDYTAIGQDLSASESLKARRATTTSDYHFSDGTHYAELATKLAQTAQTYSQWKEVATYWSYAADMMAAVPEGTPQFALAQSKREEYERNWAKVTNQYLKP